MSWLRTTLLVLTMVLPSAHAHANEKLPVIATFSILGDLVARVGGERVSVRTIVGPASDAHVYEPTPADVAAIAAARVVVENGLGFEGWLGRLTAASGFSGPVVVASRGIATADPHAWQDVGNAIAYVATIRDGLCAADPSGCAIFSANAEAYTAQLRALDGEIRRRIEAIPDKRRKVITAHEAFGHFARAYGVTFIAPAGLSTASEPSARDVARLIDQIRSEGVTALFVEALSDPRLIEQIGRETAVVAGGALYSDALSAADGPAATYIAMMRHNLTQLAGAMGSPQ